MALELVPLCSLHVQLKPPIEVGSGPAVDDALRLTL